jgi:hypothetical protein
MYRLKALTLAFRLSVHTGYIHTFLYYVRNLRHAADANDAARPQSTVQGTHAADALVIAQKRAMPE